MFPFENRDDSETLEELGSLQNQGEDFRKQDGLENQKIPEEMKKSYEPLTGTIKDISRDITDIS